MPETDIRYQVDRPARRFLSAVEYHGGSASTTQIRQHTGLDRDATNHRFRRLEELGLIEIGRAENGLGDRDPPKVAHLTGTARREIERGLLYDVRQPEDREQAKDILSELKTLNESVERLENRQNAGNESINRLEEDIEELKEWLFATRIVLEDQHNVDFEKALDRV